MDQSWRMRFGIPRFRSQRPERDPLHRPKPTCSAPDDFSDVFGGPPRNVLSRQFSETFDGHDSASFYQEVFRSPEFLSRPRKAGRILPAFRIPVKEDRFYRDVFRSDDGRRSRDRSGPNSSADLSPLRPVVGDDVAFPSSSSNHRPGNVPAQWNSYRTMFKEQEVPQFPPGLSARIDNQYAEDEYDDGFRSSDHGFGDRMSSPEAVVLEPDSFRSIQIPVDDLELNSPSSAYSSLREDPVYYGDIHCNVLPDDDDDDEDAMSSYVIEINSISREEYREEVSIDDAIAWAKSKYQSSASETDLSGRQQESEQSGEEEGRPVAFEFADQQLNGNLQAAETQQRDVKVEEGKTQIDVDRELEGLDEKIKLWSASKETNIRLLLSTLHYILWSSSGWSPISLANLILGSQVKKAYQKARLCLHPDKLQQRGATMLQKYVAEKAFTILQDAWAAYISQDVFLN